MNEPQGRRREAGSDGSVGQSRGPASRNRINGSAGWGPVPTVLRLARLYPRPVTLLSKGSEGGAIANPRETLPDCPASATPMRCSTPGLASTALHVHPLAQSVPSRFNIPYPLPVRSVLGALRCPLQCSSPPPHTSSPFIFRRHPGRRILNFVVRLCNRSQLRGIAEHHVGAMGEMAAPNARRRRDPPQLRHGAPRQEPPRRHQPGNHPGGTPASFNQLPEPILFLRSQLDPVLLLDHGRPSQSKLRSGQSLIMAERNLALPEESWREITVAEGPQRPRACRFSAQLLVGNCGTYSGPPLHLEHGHSSLATMSHCALSFVLVAIRQQTGPRSEIQEPEYMTTGKRGNESLFWIDCLNHGKWKFHDARRG